MYSQIPAAHRRPFPYASVSSCLTTSFSQNDHDGGPFLFMVGEVICQSSRMREMTPTVTLCRRPVASADQGRGAALSSVVVRDYQHDPADVRRELEMVETGRRSPKTECTSSCSTDSPLVWLCDQGGAN